MKNKSLKRSELQKLLVFKCVFDHLTTKIDPETHRPYRSIDGWKEEFKNMCILDAMQLYKESLRKAWQPDLFAAHCSNCTIYIDGHYDEETKSYFVAAYLSLPEAGENTHFEFIIHYMGDPSILEDADEFSTLENLHYIEEGKVLRLDSNFQIIK